MCLIYIFFLFFSCMVFCTLLNIFPLSLDTRRILKIGQFLPWAMEEEGNSYSTGERTPFLASVDPVWALCDLRQVT